MIETIQPQQLAKAKAEIAQAFYGGYFMPNSLDLIYQQAGLVPEKLVLPKDYHSIVRLCFDFYQKGGSVGKVIDRLQEFSVTDVRNGQRKTSAETNAYFYAVLHDKPSRLMRFLRSAALEYYIAGMVLPRIEWKEVKGREFCPDLTKNKTYVVPVFDSYPASVVTVRWAGWGKKTFWLKISDKDIKTIRNKGSRIKEQQLKYRSWLDNYPTYVNQIEAGADEIEIIDSDPILRKEISISPYPTPYLFNTLEALLFKQQLRRMDYAVAARVINAILLITEGNDSYPIVDDSDEGNARLNNLRTQILARTGNPAQMERIFMLFSNHTTKLTWVTPDVQALLDQDKYRQVNEEVDEGLGFPGILLTGATRQGSSTTEVSTWAIQPQMEELRSMLMEWMMSEVYIKAADLNGYRNMPVPSFKPIKLQDYIKTAAVFMQLYKEGNISRTTRDEMAGVDFETEAELMKDESEIAKDLPAFTPTPYSPPPPMIGQSPSSGRPTGSQNVAINNRNAGVKPSGQAPVSKVKAELWSDEKFMEELDRYAKEHNILITIEDIINEN